MFVARSTRLQSDSGGRSAGRDPECPERNLIGLHPCALPSCSRWRRVSRITHRFNPLPISLLLFALLSSSGVNAQISTDGSVGPAQALAGPDFQIGHDLGSQVGSNLFHSFQHFNIHRGESATFTGPDSIANVISRVTGGERSTIDGLLRSQVGQADFYFLNPAGVMFGADAQVDVPAAFHVSSADELRFADGATFSASDPASSTLSLAAPEAFGYLGTQATSITLNGSRLEFAPGSEVSLTGGDITIEGSEALPAQLAVEGGSLRIVAMAGRRGRRPSRVSSRAIPRAR